LDGIVLRPARCGIGRGTRGGPDDHPLKFASIPCLDQDKGAEVLDEKVGFHGAHRPAEWADQRWIELGIQKSETRFVLLRRKVMRPGRRHCSAVLRLRTTSRPPTASSRRGVQFKSPPQKAPWGTFAISWTTKAMSS